MFGKFLSVVTYDAVGAWKNPDLNRLLTKLKIRDITEEDLDKLYSLGVLSIQTTVNLNLGTRIVHQISSYERSNDEKFDLFDERHYSKSSDH